MPAHNKHRGQPKAGQSSAPPQANQPHQSFDGPDDSPSRGRSGSTAGPRASSRGPSQTRASSQTRRVDPARDRPAAPVLLRNVDFGGQAYDMFSSVSRNPLCFCTGFACLLLHSKLLRILFEPSPSQSSHHAVCDRVSLL